VRRTIRQSAIAISAGGRRASVRAGLAQLGHQSRGIRKESSKRADSTHRLALYKMTPETSLARSGMIKDLEWKFRCGVEVGKDIAMAEIERNRRDFVGLDLAVERG